MDQRLDGTDRPNGMLVGIAVEGSRSAVNRGERVASSERNEIPKS
jgi:hypothetical protein